MASDDPWAAGGADPWAAGSVAAARKPGADFDSRKPPQQRQRRPHAYVVSASTWQDYCQGSAAALRGSAASASGAHNWRRRERRGEFGERLEVIDWQGLEIVPVQKDFSFEHPAVSARTDEECEKIRAANAIHVVKNQTDKLVPKPICRFEEAPFPDWAAAQLRQMGYERPTPIQVQAWPAVLKGHDFVGIAETGSGKTIAYILPMMVHLMAQPELRPGEGPIGLVLVPTRDLCVQVAGQVESFIGATKIACRALYGGEEISQQARDLAQRMDVAVATPGRLIALLNNRATNLRRATFIVMDEADELLGRGFGAQVRLILTQIRPDRQTLLFSATWDRIVDNLAREVCSQHPLHINVGSTKLSACRAIVQRLHKVEPSEHKLDLLCKALDQIRTQLCNERHRALVFCNGRATVEPLATDLAQRGYPCRGFHGHQEQAVRDETLRAFSSPESGVWLLVCTQILGRGYDFHNVRYVINFDMPSRVGEYIHRIGRTGRAGQRGFSLTFYTSGDCSAARDLCMVLRESGQQVPDWLHAEAKRFKKSGYAARWSNSSKEHQASTLQASWPPPTDPRSSWGGRGRGRRDEFLARCGGRGVARAAPPGLAYDFDDGSAMGPGHWRQ